MSTPIQQLEQHLTRELGRAVVGSHGSVHALVVALLARGHVLVQGVPGLGKTLLAKTLARVLGGDFRRIQGTSDLMPSDIIGVHIFEEATRTFVFRPGPLFADVVLVDEINRAGPKTQSALLEAMEERQVSVERTALPLPAEFLVLATQNPREFEGTYPLPESQLDRFMLRISLDYPDRDAERALLTATDRRALIAHLEPKLDANQIDALRAAATQVLASSALIDYTQALLIASRSHPEIAVGLSPRAGLAMLHAARAYALLDGRGFCLPEDIQAIFVATAAHRLIPAAATRATRTELAAQLLAQVPVR